MKKLLTLLLTIFSISAYATPDLIISSYYLPTTVLTAGSSMTISVGVKNIGTSASEEVDVKVFLSTDNSYSEEDIRLFWQETEGIGVNESDGEIANITIPVNTPAGSYHLVFYADHEGFVSELDESNNTDFREITVEPGLPDFSATDLFGPASAIVGNTINIGCTVTNSGTANNVSFKVTYYLSKKTYLDGTETVLGYDFSTGDDGEYGQFMLPAITDGNYYILYEVDSDQDVTESNESNNIAYQAIQIFNRPDLEITSLNLNQHIFSTTPVVDFTLNVLNSGTLPSTTVNLQGYLSTDSNIGFGDIQFYSSTLSGLNVGQQTTITDQITLNPITEGDYYVIFAVDQNNSLIEISELNNQKALFTTIYQPYPDFAISNLSVPTSIKPGDGGNISFRVSNNGEISGSTDYAVYLSGSSSIPAGVSPIATGSISTLSVGQSRIINKTINIPLGATTGDDRKLIVLINTSKAHETNSSNNKTSADIGIGEIDLKVEIIQFKILGASSDFTSSVTENESVNYKVKFSNAGTLTGKNIYVTTLMSLNGDIRYATTVKEGYITLIPGEFVTWDEIFVPSGYTQNYYGTKYFHAIGNIGNPSIAESDKTNNEVIRTITVNSSSRFSEPKEEVKIASYFSNPVKGNKLHLYLKERANIQILTLDGVVLVSKSLYVGKHEIGLALPSGVYLLKIDGSESNYHKLIVE
ncbi:CARDB domain-containing protein [Roseivirga sp. BDSF3-8]|uniref:CARDB domain-containing protein n=1 Tax=Roseivirga sp. BDSF3-8 TaxID=3241598 RepID=UPI003531F136